MTTRGQDLSQTDDPLDRQLTAALEALPEVSVGDDFVARLMLRLPPRKVWTHSLPARASIGRRVALLAAAVLLLAMLGFAAPNHDSTQMSRTVAEGIVIAEFVALTVWLSLRRDAGR